MLENVIIKIKRGSTKDWDKSSYIPAEGELVYNYETNILKVGNGKDKFNNLLAI